MKLQRHLFLSALAASLLGGPLSLVAIEPVDAVAPSVSVRVAASGLASPDGLALHPKTGELYVSEEDAGRISVIRDGVAKPVIEGNLTVDVSHLPSWVMTASRPRSHWKHPKLRSPEGISFSAEGHLFVTEDIPHGRLIECIPDATGAFTTFRPVAVPWVERPYAWEDVQLTKDGRLFLAGSTFQGGGSLLFGTVLMRNPENEWFVVDYGPFASFSSVALTRNEDIVVIAEETTGAIAWWDAIREREIDTLAKRIPNIESVTVLTDGSILAVQESTLSLADQATGKPAPKGDGRLLRIDPAKRTVTTLAAGFDSIESVLVHPETGHLFLTEDGSGRLLEITLNDGVLADNYLIEEVSHVKDLQDGLAPAKWPSFLKSFVEELGIQTVDVEPGHLREGTDAEAARKGNEAYTLEEFTERIPMVAGRVKTTRYYGDLSKVEDPIDEIRFLLLYPNMALSRSPLASPSMTLFAAKHQSGKITRTKMLGKIDVEKTTTRGGARDREGSGMILFPMGSVNTRETPRGPQFNLNFVGALLFDDYFLHLRDGRLDDGLLSIDVPDGSHHRYDVTFLERDVEGIDITNLMVGGFNKVKTVEEGWYKLGDRPARDLLSLDESAPVYSKRTRILAKSINEREKAMREMAESGGGELADLPTARLTDAPKRRTFKPKPMDQRAPLMAERNDPKAPPKKPSGMATDPNAKERHAEGPNKDKRASGPNDDKQVQSDDPNRQASTEPIDEEEQWKARTLSKVILGWQNLKF